MTKKDWTGNKAAVFVCNGATGHSLEDRETNDYYATDPVAAEWLLKLEPQLKNIWECACGEGHLAEKFDQANKLSLATDIIDRHSLIQDDVNDFLYENSYLGIDDIVTNPPYKYAKEFVEKALELVDEGRYVCMFLKLTFLEGKGRKELFKKYPPIRVWVSSSRIPCAKNGEFEKYPSSATAYAWFVWQKGYKGDTYVKWFN